MKKYFYAFATALLAVAPVMAQENNGTATFEDLGVSARGYENGDTELGGFISGNYYFANIYNSEWSSWSGFALSTKKETTFNMANYNEDQYNSCVGSGYNASETYLVAFPTTYGVTSKLDMAIVTEAEGNNFDARGFFVTNTANNVRSYLNGDGMSKDADGTYTGDKGFTTGDWCKLTVYGSKDDQTVSGTVEFYLADYRSANEAEHYYVKDWTWVDISSLGNVNMLSFEVTSSRSNEYGMTTPGYFCMDNFNDANVAGISATTRNSKNAETQYYSIDGKRLAAPQKGLNIVKMSDGTTRKIVVK